MDNQLGIRSLGGTQIAVGLSAIIRIPAGAYQQASTIKIVAGSGTLWISPTPIALTGSSAAASIAAGYPLGASEVFNVSGPASFFLSAAAATMTVAIVQGYSSGYTGI